ncbi:16S rRNA (guanine(966)-N(2))-methyltransferase RsmD [Aliikangiella coralliicola]|uniref:Ribosomal RNA small subunit methyltransferase D n=1 Tax=Aliikangiella coralliicola TaxID=2592383 RepID=A0A545UFA9_9GAMM|nr:16S rRNA (guanine(966)-N(2))-methyltransferase RsmD [Aliikangiella coralliicola]TQV88154.1 16S rRNA (guanine(966)-N(2))-methyltransferase RsmD [Aliikangiella coralliicola]
MQQSKPKKPPEQRKSNQSNGIVRIIGGEMRGRKLRFATVEGLRPTLDRIRETLFNWLAKDIYGANCLDLFAGSGALGFEAISRGAKQVTMVERSAKVVRDLKSNSELLNTSNIKVIQLDSHRFLKTNQQKFDLVFLDPPFGKGLLKDTLRDLKPHLNHDGLVYVEQESQASEYTPEKEWESIKYKKTGSFSYALYRLTN